MWAYRPVFLFCRFVGGAYCCCGALSLVDTDPEARPMRFVWALRDSAALRESSASFKELLAFSMGEGG